MNNNEEELKVAAAIEGIEDLAVSMFPDEPHKAVSLLQASFLKTAMDLFENDGLLDQILASTEDMFASLSEGERDE